MGCIPMESKDEVRNIHPLAEMDVLWITAGLGCDGESIAIAAATQPSLEDLPFGALPGVPCQNQGTWPVLVGEPGQRDTMLSSPIIMYDYPRVAAEGPGEFTGEKRA